MSATGVVYPGADWFEREILRPIWREGNFEGHPDLRPS